MGEESPPAELQAGWLLDKYGPALMGDKVDTQLIIRATKLVMIHRAFSKLCVSGGQKYITDDEWRVIRDTTELKSHG